MPQQVHLRIAPEQLDETHLDTWVAARLGIDRSRINGTRLIRRSLDARGRYPVYDLMVEVWVDEPFSPGTSFDYPLPDVRHAEPVAVVGMGPAGLFAALHLIHLGKKPILIERGKSVRERRRDLALLNREGIVNPESNYCFGEGGAGTFSDGKLYTRATKRGDVRRSLELLVQFGATPDILIDAHPHIGTNKLPGIIENMREQVIACGGEVLFSTRLTGLDVQFGQLQAALLNDGERLPVKQMILATGHSARDIFELLHHQGIAIEAKPFALGLRVEHPQELIDRIQYRCQGPRGDFLPAAAYSLVRQVEGKGVYSFCMCPGGIICPAATAEGEVVVNGWSPSKRNSPFANSGMVTEITAADFGRKEAGPLDGIYFQRQVEQAAFQAGGGKQVAPAQRLTDFVRGRISPTLPGCSYLPGIAPADLAAVLPPFVHKRLKEGFRQFGQMMKGYLTEEAVVVATESRTSSPVRIPRDAETLMHPQVAGLYPCGEGAGYAGGIISAALDGQACAEALVKQTFGT